MSQFIDGEWLKGSGAAFSSLDSALGEFVWQGYAAGPGEVSQAVEAAKRAFDSWALRPLDERLHIVEAFRDILRDRASDLAILIARETGKVMWDAAGEAAAMANKIDISVKAYRERTPTRTAVNGAIRSSLTHRPHGVMAVFGPYNFPGHLPNGHIVPALIAGNTIVFKPSELTPAVAEFTVKAWIDAGLPEGVINLVQGSREVGEALVSSPDIDGLLFTGSVRTGQMIARQLASRPGVIQALELGGNNPLIVHEVKDLKAAAVLTIMSAFISSGQRCTCARRLIVPAGSEGDAFVAALSQAIRGITVGPWNSTEDVFMGPLITAEVARHVLDMAGRLRALGGRDINPVSALDIGDAYVSPGLMDVTDIDVPDEEIFGPVLQLKRVENFEAAIREAANTRYGLASGLISDSEANYEAFFPRARAGIVNWNQQLTGAASTAPFGGIGMSGNHRPSAYYAADYCAYAVASMNNAEGRAAVAQMPKGLKI